MLARWLGRLFHVVATFTRGEAGRDLAHLADELERLDARPRHPGTISR